MNHETQQTKTNTANSKDMGRLQQDGTGGDEEVKVCDNGHDPIVHTSKYMCPLCQLTTHNNTVHDFIESKGNELVKELVEYQKNINTKEEES